MSQNQLIPKSSGQFELRLNAVTVSQNVKENSHKHYLFSLSTVLVYELFVNNLLAIDRWRSKDSQGYQRNPSPRRYKEFANYISGDWKGKAKIYGDGISPTSVTLFSRNHEVDYNSSENVLRIKLDENNPIYIPDGQHRLKGMQWAIAKAIGNAKLLSKEEDTTVVKVPLTDEHREKLEKMDLSEYSIAVVLMLAEGENTAAQLAEANQFYVINTKNRRVPTNLAQQLILDAENVNQPIGKDTRIPITGLHNVYLPLIVEIVNSLAEDEGIWKDKIVLANEKANLRPINQVSFVGSLRILVRERFSEANISIGEATEIINAFWTAVSEHCPDATKWWNLNKKENRDTYYLLMQTTGVYTLHIILKHMLSRAMFHSQNKNPKFWYDMLKLANKGEIEYFKDKFWGSKGGCSIYGTSMSAFRNIADDIIQEWSEHYQKEHARFNDQSYINEISK